MHSLIYEKYEYSGLYLEFRIVHEQVHEHVHGMNSMSILVCYLEFRIVHEQVHEHVHDMKSMSILVCTLSLESPTVKSSEYKSSTVGLYLS